MVATSATNPGATGGAANHQHPYTAHTHTVSTTHTHTWTAPAAAATAVGSPGAAGANTVHDYLHTHVMSDTLGYGTAPSLGSSGPTNYDLTTTDPPWLEVIFIKSNGAVPGIPVNAVAYYNGAAPSGWTAYAAGANRLWKGAAAAGNGGGTGGTGAAHTHTSATHTHAVAAHTHVLQLNASASATYTEIAGGNTPSQASATHTAGTSSSSGAVGASVASSETTGNGDNTPPWYKVLPVQNTSSGPSLLQGLICVWTGTLATIPPGWHLCDGTAGTPNLSNGKYVNGATNSGEVGNTGGATTHTHAGGGHTHGSNDGGHTHTGPGGNSGTPSASTTSANGANNTANSTHVHVISSAASGSATVPTSDSTTSAATANTANDPPYIAVAYIQLQSLSGDFWPLFQF